ncbi:MAG: hypothetical protein LBF19_00410 [Prevotellaceae bacterium]|jgi:hypothetical protein|nr:hypothetical protein [Prevotellaceae bacterium]
MNEIVLDDKIKKWILTFMQSNNNIHCIYEIYVDKKAEGEYFITLFSVPNNVDYFTTHFPVIYTLIDNKIVFIYSGVEDFIKKEKYSPRLKIKKKNIEEKATYESLSIVIKQDTSYVVGHVGIPFIMVTFDPIKISNN